MATPAPSPSSLQDLGCLLAGRLDFIFSPGLAAELPERADSAVVCQSMPKFGGIHNETVRGYRRLAETTARLQSPGCCCPSNHLQAVRCPDLVRTYRQCDALTLCAFNFGVSQIVEVWHWVRLLDLPQVQHKIFGPDALFV